MLEIEIEAVPTASVRQVLRFVYLGRAQLNVADGEEPLDIGGIMNVAQQWSLKGDFSCWNILILSYCRSSIAM